MSKAEKIMDKVMGIFFFIFLTSLAVYGIFTLTYPKEDKEKVSPKEIPYSVPTKCVRCGHEDTLNIFKIHDSDMRDAKWKK